jgi:carboxyl-terminal processing protease
MRLTTARYYTPSGRSIQAKGIEPDILVERARLEEIEGPQRRTEASLRGHLGNGDGEAKDEDAPAASEDAPEEGAPDAGADASGAEGADGADGADDEPRDLALDDYQLARALDLLRGLVLYNQRAVN